MEQFRTEPLKGYVEPKIMAAAQRYAARNEMTVSTAVRRLVLIGLRAEREREAHTQMALRAFEGASNPKSIAS